MDLLALPRLSPALSPGPLGSESTNLPDTAHSPALQQPLAWARMSPEGMGGRWLSGSQGDRSIPGGMGWGHRPWGLGDDGRVSRAGGHPYLSILAGTSGRLGPEPTPGQSSVWVPDSLSHFWVHWLGGAPNGWPPPIATEGSMPRRPPCTLRPPAWGSLATGHKAPFSGMWLLPTPATRGPPPWVSSAACRPLCSGLSAGTVGWPRPSCTQHVPCIFRRLLGHRQPDPRAPDLSPSHPTPRPAVLGTAVPMSC